MSGASGRVSGLDDPADAEKPAPRALGDREDRCGAGDGEPGEHQGTEAGDEELAGLNGLEHDETPFSIRPPTFWQPMQSVLQGVCQFSK